MPELKTARTTKDGTKKTMMAFYMPNDLAEKLRDVSKKEYRSITNQLEYILNNFFSERQHNGNNNT